MRQPFSAGSLCSSVNDLLVWQQAFNEQWLISAESTEQMMTPNPATLPNGREMNYGYGLGIGELEGHGKIAHGGGINGFNTYLAHYRDDDLTIVVLANTEGAAPGRIEARIARAALGIPEPEIADLPLTPEQMRRYVGTYQASDLEVRLFEEDGALMAQATGQDAFRLLYQGEDRFAAEFDPEVTLRFSGDGEVAEGFIMSQAGQEISARRVD